MEHNFDVRETNERDASFKSYLVTFLQENVGTQSIFCSSNITIETKSRKYQTWRDIKNCYDKSIIYFLELPYKILYTAYYIYLVHRFQR